MELTATIEILQYLFFPAKNLLVFFLFLMSIGMEKAFFVKFAKIFKFFSMLSSRISRKNNLQYPFFPYQQKC